MVTISRWDQKKFEEEPRAKLILFFEELEKSLVVNGTNNQIATEAFGTDELDEWVGKKIVLFTDPNVMFQGRRTGGLRLRAAVDEELKRAAASAF